MYRPRAVKAQQPDFRVVEQRSDGARLHRPDQNSASSEPWRSAAAPASPPRSSICVGGDQASLTSSSCVAILQRAAANGPMPMRLPTQPAATRLPAAVRGRKSIPVRNSTLPRVTRPGYSSAAPVPDWTGQPPHPRPHRPGDEVLDRAREACNCSLMPWRARDFLVAQSTA